MEKNSVVTERFIRKRSFKKRLLDAIFDKYNNKYQRKIKIKSKDIKASTYIDCDVENNDKGSGFKAVFHVRILK